MLIFMYLVYIGNDAQLMSNFVDMTYVIIAFNPMVDVVIWWMMLVNLTSWCQLIQTHTHTCTHIYMVLCNRFSMKQSRPVSIKSHLGGECSNDYDEFICSFIFSPNSQ